MNISINTHTQTHIHTFLVLALGPKMSKAAPDAKYNPNHQKSPFG